MALVLVDLLALLIAFGAAYWIRFATDLPVFEVDVVADPVYYLRAAILLIPLFLLIFFILGLYDQHNLLGGTREYALVFNGVTTGMLIVVVATFLGQEWVVSRGWIVLSWAFGFLFVAGARFGLRRVVYRLRRRGWFLAPTLLIGTNDEARALAEQLTNWQSSGLKLVGFVSAREDPLLERFRNLYVLGHLSDLESLVAEHDVEEVVVATSALSRAQLVDLFRAFGPREDVELRLSSGLFEIFTTSLRVKELAFTPLIGLRPTRLSGLDRVLKLLLDYGVAGVAVLIGAPLLLMLALLVRLDSPGPILHRRRVLGLGGREFDAFKLRTMYVDGDTMLDRDPDLRARLARDGKLEEDPRVTRFGRWLRRTSLDELPQLFNVLRGEMSIVGPRMISPAEHEKYGQWDMNLLTVKPGLTGPWQVSGRSDLGYEERVRLDMNYIRNWTIWLDLQILLQTIPAVLKGRGAY